MIGIIIIGAGGHAKVLVDALLAAGIAPTGLIDADPRRHGATVLGIPVLGGDGMLAGFDRGQVVLVNGIGSTGHPDLRLAVQARLAALGFVFRTVIHPAAIIAAEVTVGDGAQLMAGAVVQTGTRLGAGAIINTRAVVDHDCRIGAHAHIAPGAVLCGDVRVGAASHVGAGATVVQGSTIGDGCLIGAGAVVIRDVADGVRVQGVPARSREA